jgi:hypothetical protein
LDGALFSQSNKEKRGQNTASNWWNSLRKTSADSRQFYERIALSQNKATMLQKAESAEPATSWHPKGQGFRGGKRNP